MKVFIDSNIPMYVAGRAHPNREPARRFFHRVLSGEVEGVSSTEVLQEILYRYSAIGRRDLAEQVYEAFVEICPEIYAVELADTDQAKDILTRFDAISARDAVHAAVMLNRGIKEIATFDRGFDQFDGITRHALD